MASLNRPLHLIIIINVTKTFSEASIVNNFFLKKHLKSKKIEMLSSEDQSNHLKSSFTTSTSKGLTLMLRTIGVLAKSIISSTKNTYLTTRIAVFSNIRNLSKSTRRIPEMMPKE